MLSAGKIVWEKIPTPSKAGLAFAFMSHNSLMSFGDSSRAERVRFTKVFQLQHLSGFRRYKCLKRR